MQSASQIFQGTVVKYSSFNPELVFSLPWYFCMLIQLERLKNCWEYVTQKQATRVLFVSYNLQTLFFTVDYNLGGQRDGPKAWEKNMIGLFPKRVITTFLNIYWQHANNLIHLIDITE